MFLNKKRVIGMLVSLFLTMFFGINMVHASEWMSPPSINSNSFAWSTNPPIETIDGNDTTQSGGLGFMEVVYDLNASVGIEQLRMNMEAFTYAVGVEVFISDDPGVFPMLPSLVAWVSTPAGGAWETSAVFSGEGRYVKLEIVPSTELEMPLEIYEVQFLASSPQCGDADKNYAVGESAFVGSFCEQGNIDTVPLFPNYGQTVTWSCQNGGATLSCSATREKQQYVPVDKTLETCQCYDIDSSESTHPTVTSFLYSNDDQSTWSYTPVADPSGGSCETTDIRMIVASEQGDDSEDLTSEFVGNFLHTATDEEGNGKIILSSAGIGTYSTGGDVQHLGNDTYANSVAVDSDSNIYTTGSFVQTVDFNQTGSGAADSHTSNGGSDIFITKINADGSYGYTYTIGGSGNEEGSSIVTDSSGDIYITGAFSDIVDFNQTGSGVADSHTSNGEDDIFITKINADGSYGYTYTVGGSGNEEGSSIVTDSSGDIYITGYFEGTVDFNQTGSGAADNHTNSGGADIFITKINADGSYGYTYTPGGTGLDKGLSIAINSNSDVYVTGYFNQTVDFNQTGSGLVDAHTCSGGYGDIFITKINADGSYGYTYTMGNSQDGEMGTGVAVDSGDNVYLTGFFVRTVNFNQTGSGAVDNHTSNGEDDIFITKINTDGSYGYTYTVGSIFDDRGYSVTTDSSGDIYITGYFEGTVDFNQTGSGVADNHTSNGEDDIFITKINADGSYGYTYTIGGNYDDNGSDITTDSSGNIYITGAFRWTVDFNQTGSGDAEEHTALMGLEEPMNASFLTKISADGSYGMLKTIYDTSGTYETKIQKTGGPITEWNTLTLVTETDADTEITTEVFESSCTTTLIAATTDTTIDLSNIDVSTNAELCLKTSLATTDTNKTPKLDSWLAEYTTEADATGADFVYGTVIDPVCGNPELECSAISIKNITKHSVDLRVEVDRNYRNEKQKFKVEVKNKDTGFTRIVKLKERPSDNGRVTLVINNLLQNTNYEFKIKFQGEDEKVYMYCPHKKYAKTPGGIIPVIGPVLPPVPVKPMCGSSQRMYKAEETSFEGSLCSVGSSLSAAVFPIHGSTAIWTCVNGEGIVECSARRESPKVIINLEPEPEPDPEPEPEKEPNVISTAIVLGVMIAAATPISSMPSPMMMFSVPFIKRKRQKFWGIVFDSQTKEPLSRATIFLRDSVTNKTMETAVSDDQGRYGFLISQASDYRLDVKKEPYKMNLDDNKDIIYGKVYTEPQKFEPDKPIELSIALTQSAVEAIKNVKLRNFKALLKKIIDVLLYILFFAGFAYSVYVIARSPHWINYITLSIYVISTLFLIFKKAKKHYGTVLNKENKPVPFTLVELHQDGQRKHFAISNAQGRYYLLSANGQYKLKVKGRTAAGRIVGVEKDVEVDKGILRENFTV